MGISDDIVPKYRHPGHDHKKQEQSWHDNSQHEDQVSDLDFSFPDEEKHLQINEDKFSSADDFFSKNEKEEEPKKPMDRKIIRKISGWFVAILLICLLAYLIVNNYQKIRSLLPGSEVKTNTPVSTSADTSQSTSNEIKPQDYTSTTNTDQTATTAPAVSATSATIDKSALTIQVLNGNGVSNSASTIKKTLENAGFTISSTGNAKSFSYTETYIYYKTGKDQGAELVKTALSGRTVVAEISDTVAKTYDIVVVVGKK